MDTLYQALGPHGDEAPGFKPCAVYDPELDCLTYQAEDCSCRAERVDQFLTLLWHPDKTQSRAVGVKLKGFHWAYGQMKADLEKDGLFDEHFMPLMKILEMLFALGLGQVITDEAERRQKYQVAAGLVSTCSVPEGALAA